MSGPRMAGELEIRTVGEEVLVHHPSAQKVHILNRTAGRILQLCDGTRSQKEIVETICAETGADAEMVARDVEGLISELTKLGLVS